MEGSFIKIHRWLYPVSWIYGTGVYLRNKLFDWGYLRSKSFDIPVIGVGNLAVGGTGKTPHIEYLIRLLQQNGLHIATLSRGYKRKSKGYILADDKSDARTIGDEPYQLKHNFPDIRVAVDENRCRGIERLRALKPPPIEVVLLDDAFQHRYVTPGLNILLTDYHRLFSDDRLLPAGRLREPDSSKHRAQIVIVTKCPDDIKPIDFNIIGKRLKLFPYQQLYFSRLRYGRLLPLTDNETANREPNFPFAGDTEVLLVTGIASPDALLKEIKSHFSKVRLMAFSDHHDFSVHDLKRIKEKFLLLTENNRILITTEKDAARLKNHPALDAQLKPYVYVLPVEIEFLQNQQDIFNQNIIGYVRKNSRNGNLP